MYAGVMKALGDVGRLEDALEGVGVVFGTTLPPSQRGPDSLYEAVLSEIRRILAITWLETTKASSGARALSLREYTAYVDSLLAAPSHVPPLDSAKPARAALRNELIALFSSSRVPAQWAPYTELHSLAELSSMAERMAQDLDAVVVTALSNLFHLVHEKSYPPDWDRDGVSPSKKQKLLSAPTDRSSTDRSSTDRDRKSTRSKSTKSRSGDKNKDKGKNKAKTKDKDKTKTKDKDKTKTRDKDKTKTRSKKSKKSKKSKSKDKRKRKRTNTD